jgi:hypothetical protein
MKTVVPTENAILEISDIERMNIGAHHPEV